MECREHVFLLHPPNWLSGTLDHQQSYKGNMAEVIFDQSLNSTEIQDPLGQLHRPHSLLVGHHSALPRIRALICLGMVWMAQQMRQSEAIVPIRFRGRWIHRWRIWMTDPNRHPLPEILRTTDMDCDGFDCEAGYDANGVYFSVCIDTFQQSFSEVEAHCIAGGHDGVALPLDIAENDFIFNASLAVWNLRPVSNYSIRIGGTDAASENVWLHDRYGTAMTYFISFLRTNQFIGDEHCLNIIRYSSGTMAGFGLSSTE